MRKGLKVLFIGVLWWPCSVFARQDIDTASISALRKAVKEEAARIMPDIDTVVELSNAPYLWDESIPMDADTVDDYDEATSMLIRKVDTDTRHKFQEDKELIYRQKPPRKPSSFSMGWTRYIFAFIQMLITTFWWLIVLVVLVAMGVAIFLYLRRNGYVFKRDTQDISEQVKETPEEFFELSEYEQQLQQAMAEGKLRLAVRLMYLKTLRVLAEKGIIAYSKEKTNAAYLRGLSQTQWHRPFARLTVEYEYIWYGEMPLNNEQFKVIQGQFSQFMNELGYTR